MASSDDSQTVASRGRRPDEVERKFLAMAKDARSLRSPFSDMLLRIIDHLVRPYLGSVPHICTNQYIGRDGVSLFTDHGPVHANSVLNNVKRLNAILSPPLSDYERFLLHAAALIHYLGMFLRLVEADIATQRKFHGRLAQIVLGNHYREEEENAGPDSLLDVWYIGTIARLHQTLEWKGFYDRFNVTLPDGSLLLDKRYEPLPDDRKPAEPRHSIPYQRMCQLGGALLLADGLDIHNRRADERIHVSFSQVLGPLQPKSDIEWLVNSLVSDYRLKASANQIHAIYSIDVLEAIKSLMLHFGEGGESNKHHQAATYLQTFLWRYLYDSHFDEVKAVFPRLKLKVSVEYDGSPEILKRGPTRSHRSPYSKVWSFWYDAVHQLEFGTELQTLLGEGSQLGYSGLCRSFSTCFVMVHDKLRGALRVVVPQDFAQVYSNYADGARLDVDTLAETLLQIRVPEKYSVAGQVWYRGLPEFVQYTESSPGAKSGGRMMANTIDKVLCLRQLFYLPVIEDRTLNFMLIFNALVPLPRKKEDVPAVLSGYCSEMWQAYVNDKMPITTKAGLCDGLAELHNLIDLLTRRLRLCEPEKV